MTDSVYYVNTLSPISGDGTGGINVIAGPSAAYSSMQDALNDRKGTIATGDRVIFKGAGLDSAFSVSGWDVQGELIIEGHEDYRHSGIWDESKYLIKDTSTPVTVRDENVTIQWLQITDDTQSNRDFISLRDGFDGALITNNIIRQTSGNQDTGVALSTDGLSAIVEFNIFIDLDQSFQDISSSGTSLTIRKNTFVNCDDIMKATQSGSPLFSDNVVYESLVGIVKVFNPLSDYNATDAADFGSGYTTNTHDLVNQVIEFVDKDNYDYRIISTSPLKTAGSDGGQIGAFYEPSSGGIAKEFIVKASSSENLSNKINLVKSSVLSIGISATENKTGAIEFGSGKEFVLNGSLSGNYSSHINFNKSSELLLSGSLSDNSVNKISFIKSSAFIANGTITDNYSDDVNFNKASEFNLSGSVSGNLTGQVKFESDRSFVLKGSLSENLSSPITFKKESLFSAGTSVSNNKGGTVVFSGNKTREFIVGTSLSTNLTGTVTFLTSSFPDIGDNDVECESLSVNFIVESGAVMISAESQTTVYNCFSLSRQS